VIDPSETGTAGRPERSERQDGHVADAPERDSSHETRHTWWTRGNRGCAQCASRRGEVVPLPSSWRHHP
jgi:hypothetical protein